MTEGVYDPEEIELQERLDRLRATDETPEDTQDTSFTYDTNTQYNTDGANLETNESFSRPPRITFSDPILQRLSLRYDENEDKLKKAIKDTGWEGKYTEEGLQKVSAKIWREGSKLYYAPENWNIYDKYSGDKKDDLREKGLLKEWTDKNGVVTAFALRITQDYGKLYSESSIKKYGKLFMDEFKNLIKSSGGTGDTTNTGCPKKH